MDKREFLRKIKEILGKEAKINQKKKGVKIFLEHNEVLPKDLLAEIKKIAFEYGVPVEVHVKNERTKIEKERRETHMNVLSCTFRYPLLKGYESENAKILLKPELLKYLINITEKHGFLNVSHSNLENIAKYVLPVTVFSNPDSIHDNVEISISQILKRKRGKRYKTYLSHNVKTELDLIVTKGKDVHIIEILTRPERAEGKIIAWNFVRDAFEREGKKAFFHIILVGKGEKRLKEIVKKHSLPVNVYKSKNDFTKIKRIYPEYSRQNTKHSRGFDLFYPH